MLCRRLEPSRGGSGAGPVRGMWGKKKDKTQKGGQLEATGEEMNDFLNNQGSLCRPGNVIEFVSLKPGWGGCSRLSKILSLRQNCH